METINKKQIIDKLNKKTGLPKRLLQDIVNSLLEEIKRNIELGEKVKILKFGCFVPYLTKKRKARNFKTKEKIEIQPFKKVAFYLAPCFKAELRNENKQK